MAAYYLSNFSDIVTACLEELGIQSSDANAVIKTKRAINNTYLYEVLPQKRWWWLQKTSTVIHSAYYTDSTGCQITPSSTTVTLNTAPDVAEGSFAGYKFADNGFDEVYTIASHTAGSTTITLGSAYQGASVKTAASFKIWKEVYPLPTDLRETVDIYHHRHAHKMKGVGPQELNKIKLQDNPKLEGFPFYYSTGDFNSDTAGEATRFREFKIFPAIHTEGVTLNIDYIVDASALDLDADEPLMPADDRIVLVYGALSKLWTILESNPEEATRNYGLFQRKLAAMAGRVEDSTDTMSIGPKSRYLSGIRRTRMGARRRADWGYGASGSSGLPSINYLESVTLNGGTFTGNFTASAGVTIDGRDISVDGATLDSLQGSFDNIDTANRVVITDGTPALEESSITATELLFLDNVQDSTTYTLTDNTASPTATATFAIASYTGVIGLYTLTRTGSNKETGIFLMTHDGSSTVTLGGMDTQVGTLGVTFSADISGGNMRLLYTTTSTGNDASLKIQWFRWV